MFAEPSAGIIVFHIGGVASVINKQAYKEDTVDTYNAQRAYEHHLDNRRHIPGANEKALTDLAVDDHDRGTARFGRGK